MKRSSSASDLTEERRLPQDRRGPVLRVARWSTRHRWTAVTLWVIFVVAAMALGSALGTKQNTNDGGVGESQTADAALNGTYFPGHEAVEHILIQPRQGAGLDPAAVTSVYQDIKQQFAHVPGAVGITVPLASADGRSWVVNFTLDTGTTSGHAQNDLADRLVTPALAATARVQADHPNLSVAEVGSTSLKQAGNAQVGKDLSRSGLISVPVALVILAIAFGALLAAAVPVVLALTAVLGSMGLAALASQAFPLDPSVSAVMLLIGLAVGVDYSLFYIHREREEKRRGATKYEAIEAAAATSGRAVVVSGITVIIAMAGMFLSTDAVFESFAIGTILVVAVAVIGSVTVLPALLALFGNAIERPRVPLVHRLRRPDGESRLWTAILRPVLAKPAISALLATAALLALAVPALGMVVRVPGVDQESSSTALPIIQTYDRLNAAFPQDGEDHVVVVKSDDGKALPKAATSAALDRLDQKASASPLFAVGQNQQVVYSADGTVAYTDLPIPYSSNDPRATQSLDLLRDSLVPATLGALPGTWHGVTGDTADIHDFNAHMEARLPLVFAFVLGLTFLIMLMTFSSLIVALTSIVLNLLSVGAAYGVLVLVFQGHWAEGLLGFKSDGGIVSWLPLFLFVILFGLSMDYHVFLVSRIREHVRPGTDTPAIDTREAVRQGVTRTASTVTSAAIVMVCVFAIFAVTPELMFKQLGVGLAAAVLLDATLVRGVLLPATMALLGSANWYLPRWLGWLPRLGDELPAAPSPVPSAAVPHVAVPHVPPPTYAEARGVRTDEVVRSLRP